MMINSPVSRPQQPSTHLSHGILLQLGGIDGLVQEDGKVDEQEQDAAEDLQIKSARPPLPWRQRQRRCRHSALAQGSIIETLALTHGTTLDPATTPAAVYASGGVNFGTGGGGLLVTTFNSSQQ